ncbi:hypothetical protein HaLaN_10217, partial [Haematococcus lacustris]
MGQETVLVNVAMCSYRDRMSRSLVRASHALGLAFALGGLGGLSCLLNLGVLVALVVQGPGSEAAACVAAWLPH